MPTPAPSFEIANIVRKRFRIPTAIDDRGPLPATSAYAPLRDIQRTGFTFEAGTLLHAIGCKVAALPSNDRDRCLNSAFFMAQLLDFGGQHLCFARSIEADLQTSRSQELGIAVTCLFAKRYWGIPWDSLESIRGRGKRFDYRGERPGIKAIFEAKGTRHRNKQPAQIAHGLAKKVAHHKRREHYDVELILSSHVGGYNDRPRVLLADPEGDAEEAFGEWAKDFFRAKHYSRVLQFAGAPAAAYRLWRVAKEALATKYDTFPRGLVVPGTPVDVLSEAEVSQLPRLSVGRRRFAGQWVAHWAPRDSRRYARLLEREKGLGFSRDIVLFQGLDEEVANVLATGSLELPELPHVDEIVDDEFGNPMSLFSDGSVCVFSSSKHRARIAAPPDDRTSRNAYERRG